MTTNTPRLYRGTVNNGVHTVLTEEAVDALRRRELYFSQHGTHEGTEAWLEVAAAGTFCFVHARHLDRFARLVAGTLEDMDEWCGGRLIPSGIENYVPFNTNRLPGQDQEYIRTPREVIQAFGLARRLSI